MLETEDVLDEGLHIDDSIVRVNQNGQITVLIYNRSNALSVVEILKCAGEEDVEPSRDLDELSGHTCFLVED